MNKEKNLTYKLVLSGLLVGISVLFGTFSIPMFGAKISPIQHFVNVISGITLGPWFAILNAFSSSFIRNILGTGSLLAFPGSMIGALFAGLFYKWFKNMFSAVIGEFIGTGIIGAMLAYPISSLLLGKEASLFLYVIPFSLSCIVGAIFAYVLLKISLINKILVMKKDNI